MGAGRRRLRDPDRIAAEPPKCPASSDGSGTMQVTILGSGSPLPDPERAGPSTLVRTSAGDLLFDCGRGVLMRAAAVASGAGAFRALLLTHLHSDHITDLGDVFTTRWITSSAPNPLPVFGPRATAALLQATEAMLEPDIGYRLAHHDDLRWRPSATVCEVDHGVVFEEGAVRVTAAPTDHAPVRPTAGFRIDDGERSVVIAGDTVPCAGLDELCAGADVLDYHSSVADAAQTAARGVVRTLVLTHLVPAPAAGTEQGWLDQAGAHFPGEVLVARDLLTLDVAG